MVCPTAITERYISGLKKIPLVFWLFPRISYHRLESTTNFMQILCKDEGHLKLIRDTVVIKNIWEGNWPGLLGTCQRVSNPVK